MELTPISAREAAKMLNVYVDAVYYGLQQNTLPIGWAYFNEEWAYKIFKEWVEAYMKGERLAAPKEGGA